LEVRLRQKPRLQPPQRSNLQLLHRQRLTRLRPLPRLPRQRSNFKAVECIGPDAFRVYPGILREDTVTWLNLWVVADYTLEKMIEEVNRITQVPAGF
jgi:hypothetical protein